MTHYQICSRCVMDTSVPNIRFDALGICQFCKMHDEMDRENPLGAEGERRLAQLVDRIRKAGRGKDYDCICGVSGGRDSTYILYTTVKTLGLRPLAVHFDNGWNSETAVTNIQNACHKLNVDLETVVADWNEFRDLLVSFLKASVPDVDVPTDVAIHGVLHRTAAKERVKYILNGHCYRTEGIAPLYWTYLDGRYVNAIHRRFGNFPLKDFHNFTALDFLDYRYVRRINVVNILNFMPYERSSVDQILKEQMDWTYYGGHHYESLYTKFIQSYLLPTKFNIDRRRTELSALIRAGQIQRQHALEELGSSPTVPDWEELRDYVLAKLELSREEFDVIIRERPKSFRDYPSYYPIMQSLRWPLKLAVHMRLLPRIMYLKFLS